MLLAGVQSNQFPRAADLAREFRAAGIPVVVGGFHVSGCLAMLPDLPAELRASRSRELPSSPARPKGGWNSS